MKLGQYAKNAGDIVRGGSALATIASAVNWYNGVKERVLGEIIDKLGSGLTTSVDIPLGVYGIGEAVNFRNDYLETRRERENFFQYVGRFAREAPLQLVGRTATMATVTTPLISRLGDNDFFSSVLIPAAVVVGGHTLGYVVRAIQGKR